MYGNYNLNPMDYAIIAASILTIIITLLVVAYRNSRPREVSMAEYRRMIGWKGYPHDGSVEYVLTNSQIKAMVKPVLFDQDGYFPEEEV